MYQLIDGKKHSEEILSSLAEDAEKFYREHGRRIGLAVINIGEDPASKVYIRNKYNASVRIGIDCRIIKIDEGTASQEDAEKTVRDICADDTVDGVIVQLPLPKKYDESRILALIPVEKDVDGFSHENIGRLCLNDPPYTAACTPNGVMKMLEAENVGIAGKNAVVVGRSAIVGKPMAMLLLNANATVTVCHSKTKNLKEVCSQADILVVAIGKAKYITADMVKEGAVVIDVGMDRDENGKLCGDVDFENVREKCSKITPVPGGVGPMTVAMLLYNTCRAAERGCNGIS